MIREICRGFVYVYSTRLAPCVKNLHGIGISWRIRTSISMEFHGNFSMGFHGQYLHGGLGHFPWNFMEISPSIFSLEDYDIFHGISWKSSMQLHLAETIEPRTISILSNQTRVCVHVKLTFSYTARSGFETRQM